MAGLTAKQQRFVEEYLIDLNATQAAIRAGYSSKTAYSIEYGKEAAKARIKDVVTNDAAKLAAAVGIDMAGSIIPGIGSAISAYRTQRQRNS